MPCAKEGRRRELTVWEGSTGKATLHLWHPMLHYSVTFLVVSLIAAVLGFGGIAGTAAELAKICFFVFLVLFVVSFITGRKTT